MKAVYANILEVDAVIEHRNQLIVAVATKDAEIARLRSESDSWKHQYEVLEAQVNAWDREDNLLPRAESAIRKAIEVLPEGIKACLIVEKLLRSLGGKCVQVSITPNAVEVAPVEWAGSSTGKTLAEALADALKSPATG